jgi:hypothetical protein
MHLEPLYIRLVWRAQKLWLQQAQQVQQQMLGCRVHHTVACPLMMS